ncbi:unnamed protein product, partial [Choristocarpus tenellus]
MVETKELRLAEHFPLVSKACKKPATAFFDCFSEKGNQPPEGDKDAGRTGLASCEKLMQVYDTCMEKEPARKLIRVR